MAGQSIGTLKAFLTLDTKNFLAGFGSAQKMLSSFAGAGIALRIGESIAGIGESMLSTVKSAVSFRSVMESLERVGHLSSISKKLGISVEATQQLGMAAEKSGIDLDTLANGLLMMGKNIGSGGKSLDKRLFDISDAFVKITDQGKRAEFSRSVFGKGGFEFMNLLAKGSSGIRQSADAVERFGLAIKDVDAANAKEAVLTFKEMGEVFKGLKDKLSTELAPAITEFFKQQLTYVETLTKAYNGLKNVIDNTFPGASGAIGAGAGRAVPQAFMNLLPGGPLIGALLGLPGAIAGPGKKAGADVAGLLGGNDGAGTAMARAAHFTSGSAIKGSVEAGRIIQQARGSPFETALKPVVDRLDKVIRNTDERKNPRNREPGIRKADMK